MSEGRKRAGGMVEAECPRCGPVRVSARDIVVYVREDVWTASYLFRCPGCSRAVRKEASQEATEILVAWGARVDLWRAPAEFLEPKDGPPLTLDDLIDFHFLLEEPDWFDALTAGIV